ncbi:hypothetical protein AAVH_12514 [Aphelenchoides avenae]|nr:hypothetical protein AAVH_12514 [Aphelenchus avenae]
MSRVPFILVSACALAGLCTSCHYNWECPYGYTCVGRVCINSLEEHKSLQCDPGCFYICINDVCQCICSDSNFTIASKTDAGIRPLADVDSYGRFCVNICIQGVCHDQCFVANGDHETPKSNDGCSRHRCSKYCWKTNHTLGKCVDGECQCARSAHEND